jgi:hypothetical protein
VQVGTSATAFATLINAGHGTATCCSLAPATNIPATFVYQTTDPATNAVTGDPNMPVDIPSGQARTFMFAVTPSSPLGPSDVQLTFACANSDPAPITTWVNTVLFSASSTPVPDIVALAATASGDGIVTIPWPTGTGAFAVATVNVGASELITASADTGSASLPLTLSVCQTNPVTAACLAPPTSSVATQIDANTTPTFSIFAEATGPIPFLPGTNRIVVRFKDGGGVTRGATSVAVRTVP